MFSNVVDTPVSRVVEKLINDWILAINAILKEKQEIAIALSGGNTPQLMFNMLAEQYKDKIPWNRIHFFWVDERWVPHESIESNYGNAKRILFDRVDIPNDHLHPINTADDDPSKEAIRYSNEIMKFVEQFDNIPAFDIIFLGMGDDGHVASIFPGQEELFETNQLCAVTQHPQTGQTRITLTGKIINHSRYTVFLITGKQKSTVLQTVFESNKMIYPVQYVRPKLGGLFWYIDLDAAKNIRRYKVFD
ncbi:MAG: 6-phosphogluconolactonase [Bacteroidales bacterium]|nr:6-phosphogluconolactonase [Bacteroidales bacterium]